ncbi:cysteine-rich KTR domain-containing protein [Candidatus Enterococcus murrayae]|uniref:Conjugal transfer protein n=1 Tax=Candidatus Enterococcus murrayae TaxID=2815321 RepID=A0ABS3HNL7_9ENTE|nr:cysteine-rich KTR domain-containing protein [Enterococcus sp. MJM16]MBO0454529.1 conjugal transfer protein [Enterococcus sp. MJM16]
MNSREWLLCPNCKKKTRVQICENTLLKNFPLYCPKCKQETMIDVIQKSIILTREPIVKT